MCERQAGMELTIYPYRLTQRTEYSKIRIFDIENNKYIEDSFLSEKIMNDYNLQLERRDEYFKIKNGMLTSVDKQIDLDKIDFVFIPEDVTAIESCTFSDMCFKYISLPNSVNYIGAGAFARCNGLRAIEVPDKVKVLHSGMFNQCVFLKTISLPKLKEINTKAFCGCTSLESIDIPDTVEIIKPDAFSGCISLKNIHFPKELRLLGNSAFAGCSELEEINLPSSLASIGEEAFKSCYKLKKVVLPNSVNQMSPRAFSYCTSLRTIKLPENMKLLHTEMFRGCNVLEEITLPDSLKSMGDYIFSGCEKLHCINIPKDLLFSESAPPFGNSSIKTLFINYDFVGETSMSYDFFRHSAVNKLVISGGVRTLTSDVFKGIKNQIRTIDYLGTKEEFNVFRNNNTQLFDVLASLKEINFVEKGIVKDDIAKQER